MNVVQSLGGNADRISLSTSYASVIGILGMRMLLGKFAYSTGKKD